MKPQRLVDLLTLVALILLGLSAYLPWTTVNGEDSFKGYDLTRAPVFLALAAVVAVIVTKLAGTALRRVLGVLVMLLGVLAVVVAIQVHPELEELSRLRPGLTLKGTDSFVITAGPARFLAAAGGLTLVAAGLLAVLTAHLWRRATARYERDPAAAGSGQGVDQWKAIDAGEDPTL